MQTEQTQIDAPHIDYQHSIRTSTLSGDQFTQTAVNSSQVTNTEQSTIQNFFEITPQAQENIDTSAEQYINQNFDFNQFNMMANEQLNHDGMLIIDADRFERNTSFNLINNLFQPHISIKFIKNSYYGRNRYLCWFIPHKYLLHRI